MYGQASRTSEANRKGLVRDVRVFEDDQDRMPEAGRREGVRCTGMLRSMWKRRTAIATE